MYGAYIPPGVDPVVAEVAERFAEYMPSTEEQVKAALEWIKDEVDASLDLYLDGIEELTYAQAKAIKQKVRDIIDEERGNYHLADDGEQESAFRTFMEEERGRGLRVAGSTVLQLPLAKPRRAKRA